MDKKYYVYILECADGTYYTGRTTNIEERLRKHNGEISGGAKYTRSRRPVNAVYTETYETVNDALKREYELKQLTHTQKELLILNYKSKTL